MSNVADSHLQSSSLAARVVRHLSETHRIAFARLSANFRVTDYSENFRDILIDPPDVIEGHVIETLIWEFVGAEDGLSEVLEGKIDRFQIEYAIRERPPRDVQYLNFIVIPVIEQNPSEGLLLIVEDVTDRGILERALLQERNELLLTQNLLSEANVELQRLNRLKSLFLSMAAHDLRAPLTIILGYIELQRDLLQIGKIDEAEKYLAIVTDQVERLNRLIRDFLDLDLIEEGNFQISGEYCDLRNVFQETTDLMRHTAYRNHIELVLELPDGELPVQVDPERIQQVVYNLLSNAIKYTSSGGKVWISAKEEPKYISFRVEDNGRGMTQEELSRLFQIYYRTAEAKESITEGTGLGLFIVKTIVEAHHGQVKVVSQPKSGSIFTVFLPKPEAPNGMDERDPLR